MLLLSNLGGHHFKCDCNVKWVVTWIREFDLQVTSRDRDPQYCGFPSNLKHKTFYELQSSDLECSAGPHENSAVSRNSLIPSTIKLTDEESRTEIYKSSTFTRPQVTTQSTSSIQPDITVGNKKIAKPPIYDKAGSQSRSSEVRICYDYFLYLLYSIF